MPRLYRKRPVTIEAVLFDGTNVDEVVAFVNGAYPLKTMQDGIVIRTLEGDMLASPGDYVIKGIESEFYPCRSDIFEATYDPLL